MNKTLLSFAGVAALALSLPASGGVMDIGSRKQLFVDHSFVRDAGGVELRMNPPEKGGIVLSGANGWENGVIAAAGRTVLEENGIFRMWYVGIPATSSPNDDDKPRLCYAESTDGINWRKPNLGLYEWKGSKANNIIMETARENGGGVFADPNDLGDRHYKLLALMAQKSERWPDGNAPNGSGFYLYTSRDGLRWQFHPARVFPFYCDTVNMAFYDQSRRRYLAFVRTWMEGRRRVGVVEMTDIMQPWPYDKNVPPTSPHKRFTGMVQPKSGTLDIAPSTEIPDAFGYDGGDPKNVDHYTSAVVKYPWADRAYFMFPSAYRHFPEPPEGKYHNDGTLDIELAVSRDGRKYHRISRRPYIERGLRGSPDSDALYMGIGMLRRGSEIYQYYGAFDYSHGSYDGFAEIRNRGGVFLARQRLDGFVSIDADDKGGQFTTPGLIFRGRQLALNMNPSATGDIRVELRGADGVPLPGYSFAESDPLLENDVAEIVTWRRGFSDLAPLAGRPVRVAFRLRNVKLYAFQFVE